MHIPDDKTCQCTGCELVRRGQDLLKLRRENERLWEALQRAVGIIKYGDELAAAKLLEELLGKEGGVQ